MAKIVSYRDKGGKLWKIPIDADAAADMIPKMIADHIKAEKERAAKELEMQGKSPESIAAVAAAVRSIAAEQKVVMQSIERLLKYMTRRKYTVKTLHRGGDGRINKVTEVEE